MAFGSIRRAAAAGLWVVFAGGTASAEDLDCLWSTLTSSDKARLELAVLTGEPPPMTLLNRWGETQIAAHYQRCRIPFDADALQRATRYLSARVTAEILLARLVKDGPALDRIETALAEAAPRAARKDLAEDIMTLQHRSTDGAAARAVASAAQAIEQASRRADGASPDPEAILRLAAEWAAARILADGLEAGAQPPKG